MKRLFLDTSYLIALIRKRDNLHLQAVEASQSFTGPFLTTDLVLLELANSLASPPFRETVVAVIERIREDRQVVIVPITSSRLAKAFDLFKKRPDKAWGMIDCFSFTAMDEAGVKQVLTFDEHFIQAGFKAPLITLR